MATISPPKENIIATQRNVIIPRSIINPQSSVPITTGPTPGDLNPVSRRTTLKYMNVNTANRHRSSGRGATAPALSSRSTNCILDLVSPVRDVLSLRPTSIVIPSAPYAISQSKFSNKIWLQIANDCSLGVDAQALGCVWSAATERSLPEMPDAQWYSLRVPDGNYQPKELRDILEKALHTAQLSSKFQILFDHTSCTFSLRGTSDAVLAVAFATDRPTEGSLGWIMGFRDRYYSFSEAGNQVERPLPFQCPTVVRCTKRCFSPPPHPETGPDPVALVSDALSSLTGSRDPEPEERDDEIATIFCSIYAESTFSLFGSTYYMLCIDDYHSNVDHLFLPDAGANLQTDRIGARQNALARIDFRISNDGCSLDIDLTPSKRIFFGPVTLEKLKVMLIDDKGEEVDLNHSDFSFCLEIESFYKF